MKLNVTPQEFSDVHRLANECWSERVFDEGRWLSQIREWFGEPPVLPDVYTIDVKRVEKIPCEGVERWEDSCDTK